MPFVPLDDVCRDWIVAEVDRTLLAMPSQPALGAWFKHHIDNLLWYWSVDRMRSGGVERDAIHKKRDAATLMSLAHTTARARAAHAGARDLNRDHVVPKRVLIAELTALGPGSGIVAEVLHRFCFVTFMQEAEHKAMRHRSTMPVGWDAQPLLQRDPWARYRGEAFFATIQPTPYGRV